MELGIKVFVAAGVMTAVMASTDARAGERVRYDGHSAVRAFVHSHDELETVLGLSDDVWSERVGVGPVDVLVGPDGRAALDAAGLDYDVLVGDVQLLVDEERLRLDSPAQHSEEWFSDYRDYETVVAYLEDLAELHPERATLLELGTSIEGRSIPGLRIGGTEEDRPGVFLNSAQHAREWISVMVTVCIADALLENPDQDPLIDSLLDQLDIYVVPIVNPDGYVYSWDVERFWRKNRRDDHGVDLNRNWGVVWGGEGSSDDPENGTYRGTEPFSEPESDAVRQFFAEHPALVTHIDFHAYSQLILFPWGFWYDPAPAHDELMGLASDMHDAMLVVHGEEYGVLQGSEFYPAAGNAPDWTYGDHGTLSFTIELRPAEAEEFQQGFVLPPEQILPTCDEALAGVLTLAEWSVGKEPGRPGDDGNGNLTTGPDETSGGDELGDDTSDGSEAGTTGDGTGMTTEGDGPAQDDPNRVSSTCACRPSAPAPAGVLLIVGLAALRRRRR